MQQHSPRWQAVRREVEDLRRRVDYLGSQDLTMDEALEYSRKQTQLFRLELRLQEARRC